MKCRASPSILTLYRIHYSIGMDVAHISTSLPAHCTQTLDPNTFMVGHLTYFKHFRYLIAAIHTNV